MLQSSSMSFKICVHFDLGENRYSVAEAVRALYCFIQSIIRIITDFDRLMEYSSVLESFNTPFFYSEPHIRRKHL